MSAEPILPVRRIAETEFLTRYSNERPSYEFVNGKVVRKPLTKRTHMVIAGELSALFRAYRRGMRGSLSGEDPTIDLSEAADRRYRAPDVAYWAPGKAQGGEVLLAPTLAIEIQPEGQGLHSLRSKCREYRERGVDVVWLVVPAQRSVEMFDGTHDGVTVRAPATLRAAELPGFEVDLEALFGTIEAD